MDEKYIRIIKKRILIIGIFTTILFICLALRLYYLQIYRSEELLEAAIRQRGKEISLYPKRGIIYDRNLVPLTNNHIVPMVIVDKNVLQGDQRLIKKLRDNTLLSYREFNERLGNKERILQIPLTKGFKLEDDNNIFLVDLITRYGEENLLSHVIGYINKSDNVGKTGIEKLYDEFLRNGDSNSFIVEFDKNRSFILDGIYRANQNTEIYNPSAVKLTIDYEIQKRVESILDKKGVNGAVIVAEIDTGEIVAMASRPNFDQDDIEMSLYSEDMALYNKAIQVGYPPGSIFKIVVLLTALEEESIDLDSEYYCRGFEEVNGIKISCSATHRNISLRDGFAKSCNSVFIQIGKEIGAKKIIDMAAKLGFGDKINIGLLEEIEGNLPKDRELLGAAIGNIAIGQGQLEVTPLQITNLMLTVANRGFSRPLSIAKGITNRDGLMIKKVYKENGTQIISERSADIILDFLREVSRSGTARSMELDDIGGCGGKTGSAEAILNKKRAIHGWFSGFYPSYNPKYVITVLVEDSKSGSISAIPIFEEIAREINRYKIE